MTLVKRVSAHLRYLTTIVLVVAALAALGCQPAAAPRPTSFVPEGVDFIGGVELARVLGDPDLKEFYESVAKDGDDPATFEAALAKVHAETGIDVTQFSRLTFFGSSSGEQAAAVVEGSFVQADLLKAIEQAFDTQASTSQHNGHDLHVFSVDDSPDNLGEFPVDLGDEEAALAFLDAQTLVVGHTDMVRQVIDVFEGDRDGASGSVMDAYEALGDSLVRFVVEVPSDVLGDLDDRPLGLPFDVEAFSDIQLVAIEVDKDGGEIKATVSMEFGTSASAAQAGDTIDGFLKLARGLLPDEEIRDVLKGLEVATIGKKVKIDFEITVDRLRELAENPPELDLTDLFR